jgi:hypothetical protein
VTLGVEETHEQALPTILCPDGRAGDYVTIGAAATEVRRPR